MIRPKQVLKEIRKEYPNVWKQIKDFRAAKGKELPNWADWCYLPIAAGIAIATQGDDLKLYQVMFNKINPAIIVAGATWRVTQGVYKFDPDLYNTLINQPLEGNIPCEALKKLPEWCVYIEMYDKDIEGFWAHLEDDINTGREELRLVVMYKNGENMCVPIHLGDWTIEEGLKKMIEEARKYMNSIKLPAYELPNALINKITGMIQLILYLCADNIDISQLPQHPKYRVRQSGQVDIAREVKTWGVGQRIGATIRKYRNSNILEETENITKNEAEKTKTEENITRIHSSPRPHIRRAHWHSYWIGPKDGERKLILHWLPPIFVNMKEIEDLPVVIHRVE